MKTTANIETVKTALLAVNQEKGYELECNRLDQCGKWVNFTIKSKSGIPGSRLSGSGRKLAKASWHAHGFVMDKIFEIEPDCVIISMGEKLYAGHIWQDRNIGSQYNPVYFSATSIL